MIRSRPSSLQQQLAALERQQQALARLRQGAESVRVSTQWLQLAAWSGHATPPVPLLLPPVFALSLPVPMLPPAVPPKKH